MFEAVEMHWWYFVAGLNKRRNGTAWAYAFCRATSIRNRRNGSLERLRAYVRKGEA